MPSRDEVLKEINDGSSTPDSIRRRYLSLMHAATGRNVIAYYSGFLQKSGTNNTDINNDDINAFMGAVYGLDKSKGLDLILHTPGGIGSAAETIVFYLKSNFGNDIRAFVPQIALSAGTMIALGCREIVMGKQSSLGPIDPQIRGGMSCPAVLDEFERARREIRKDESNASLWGPILSKFKPALLSSCQNHVRWCNRVTTEWLCSNMFREEENPEKLAQNVVAELGDYSKTYFHGNHYHIDKCRDLGLKVTSLESIAGNAPEGCKDLQDCVLTIHHAYMITFSESNAVKIVENHNGNGMTTNDRIREEHKSNSKS